MPDALDVYSGNNNGQPIDVACAKAEGVQLIIPKCTEGVTFLDPCFAAVYNACHEQGVRTGGYHFVRPDRGNTGHAEAAHMLDTWAMGVVPADDVLACDFESYPGIPWPLAAGDESVEWLLDFLREIESATGIVPWVYTNWNFLVNILGKDDRLRRYPWWYANPAPNWPEDWPPALWQYGYADVPCGVGVCDGNTFGPAYDGGGAPPPGPPPPSVRMPFDGNYPVTSPYGPREGGFHYGIDFGLPEGTPVVAVADGTVIFAGFEAAGGNHLAIDLDDPALPNKCGYMHLQRFSWQAGDRVTAGQIVGWSDTTGAAVTGPHLHFWMGDNANVGAVDPSPYLWPAAPLPPVPPPPKEPPDMWIAYMDDSGWCDLWHPAGVIVDSYDSHQPNPNSFGVGELHTRYVSCGIPVTHFPDGAAGGGYDKIRARLEAAWKAGGAA